MLELQEAIKINYSLPPLPLKIIEKNIFDSQGYVLAQDYFIQRPLPLFDNSAMDGYAIYSENQSLPLNCTRRILAGDDASNIALQPNEAIRIMTGAMIPKNANLVVPFEFATLQDQTLTLHKTFQAWDNIRKQGEEKKQGDLIAKKGIKLDFGTIGLLASQGIDKVVVFEKPHIGVFSSGSEIKEPGENALPHQIYNINAPSIMAILKQYHQEATYLGVLNDDNSLEKELLQKSLEYPILITSGGASVGDADLLEKVLIKNNAEIFYHKINLKPGKPLMIAKLNQCYIFCLPGNPLSGIINLIALLISTIMRLSCNNAYHPIPQYAVLKEDLNLKGNRAHMLLGNLSQGVFTIYKNGKYSPNAISTFNSCDHIAIFDSTTNQIKAGTTIKVLPYFMDFSQKEENFINSFQE